MALKTVHYDFRIQCAAITLYHINAFKSFAILFAFQKFYLHIYNYSDLHLVQN